MDDFSAILKAYLEVGILGLCGILFIIITYLNYRNNSKRLKEQDKDNDDKFDQMFKMLQKQTEEYREQSSKNYELLMKKLIDNSSPHVLTAEEDMKITKVNEEVNRLLQQLLISTGASRTSIIQYHNGGKGKNNQSFLKMSMTNEVTDVGVKPLMTEFKDQFRNVLAYFVKEIGSKGYCYIENSEDIKGIDYGTYDFLENRGIRSKFGIALRQHNNDNCNYESENVIGFICLEFLKDNKSEISIEKIDSELKHKQISLEILLNL